MKNILMTNFLWILASSLLLLSCNNSFMDRYPLAEVSPENSFQTAKDLELYTNGFYENLPEFKDIIEGDLKTDNVLYTSIPSEQRSHERTVPSDAGSGGWSWGDLREINLFFDNYERCTDVAARNKYEGVARFLEPGFILIK